MKKLDGLKIAHQLAKNRDGKCLSREYINNNTKMQWECSKGHRWYALFSSIKYQNSWCPECYGNKKLEIARDIAKLKNGKCLSIEYINSKASMRWACSKNHEWDATLSNIKRATWCPECAQVKKLNGLETAYQIATDRGGKCLSTKYINTNKKMHWECSEGHKWFAILCSIKNRNSWCNICSSISSRESVRLDGLKIANNLAKAKGGKCLSTEYINNKIGVRWICKEGHKWTTSLSSVKNNGTWCPECSVLIGAKKLSNSFILYHWKTGGELICQASYEKAVVEYLNKNKINFRWQPKTFITDILTQTGKLSTYRPDMYLFSGKKWIEIKGYFRKHSKQKWDWFQTIKPNSELWDKNKLKKMKIL